METTDLHAVWTYRSFHNQPAMTDDFNELRLDQGELVFERTPSDGALRGQLAYRSDPPTPRDARLALVGSTQQGTPRRLHFRGVGVPGTDAEGWELDFEGYLVPPWPEGQGQTQAIVGSVVAGSDANGQTAGQVSSFIAVDRGFPEANTVIPLPDGVLQMVGSRQHRLHHMVWHGARNFWLAPWLSEQAKQRITDLHWAPPRPSIGGGQVLIANGSGEDFLFMHRQMIKHVTHKMHELGLPPIPRWTTIPSPGPLVQEPNFRAPSPTLPTPGNPGGYTVPPTWIDPSDTFGGNERIAALKTDEYYWSRMRWWDRQYKDPAYLRTLTLGELGALIEFSIHNDMHMRWSSVPRHPETGAPLASGRGIEDTRPIWDNVANDYLGDFYSSHVHPVFWRLHGWVDDRIDDWFRAHDEDHPGEVHREQVGGIDWFCPGKWVQVTDPWSQPAGGLVVEDMEAVIAAMFGPPPSDDPAPSAAAGPPAVGTAAAAAMAVQVDVPGKPVRGRDLLTLPAALP